MASLTSTACGVAADATTELRSLARPELLSLLGPDAVRELGLRYREMVPAENEAEALHDAIRASLPWTPRLLFGRRSSIEDLVREDYAAGRTVLLDGWVLSATEARQCALFSLLPS